MKEAREEYSLSVAGHTFVARRMRVMKCSRCKEVTYPLATLMRIDLLIAAQLARAGENSGEAMRFMRKAVGVKAMDLAALMDMSPEHLSRLENGKKPVDARIMALLGSMALDALEGRSTAMQALNAQQHPKKLGKSVPLEFGDPPVN